MSGTNNLWPEDLLLKKITMPKNILLEQGQLLSKMSGNLLTAEVRTSGASIHKGEKASEAFIHEFIIKAPSLGNYQLPLLRVVHEQIAIYPFSVYSILEDASYNITDEETYIEVLKNIFSNEKTRNSITYIISQA